MIALDTSVIVRYLVEDDPKQSAAAVRLIERELSADEPGFLSTITLVELARVLESTYRRSAPEIRLAFTKLLNATALLVEDPAVLQAALSHEKQDLSDALIHEVGKANGCTKTMTFDRKFARLGGVELLG